MKTPDQAANAVALMIIQWRDRLDPQREGIETWRCLSALKVAYPEWENDLIICLAALICHRPRAHVEQQARHPGPIGPNNQTEE